SSPFAMTTTYPNETTPRAGEELSVFDKALLLSDGQRALAATIQTPLKYIFIAMATPLTLCNVIVFSQKDMRSASGTYVIGLNAGQLLYIFFNTVSIIWSSFVNPPYSQSSFCIYEIYIAHFGGVLVAKRASYAILCLASAERLYAVVRPLHVKNFVLSKHPVIGVLSVYALSAIWHVYYLAKYRMVMVNIASGHTVCRFLKTELYLQQKDVNDAFGLSAKIILTYISLLLQLVLNVLTIWALQRHNMAARQVQSTTNEDAKRQQERQLTFTLLCASAAYVLLSLPAAFLNLISTTVPEFTPTGKYRNVYAVYADFSYNMTMLGCGVDFFCYLALSSKYRNMVFRLIGRKTSKGLGKGSCVVSSGSCVVSSGSCLVSSGSCVVSTGSCVVSSGSCVVSSGSCVVSSGSCVIKIMTGSLRGRRLLGYFARTGSNRRCFLALVAALGFCICLIDVLLYSKTKHSRIPRVAQLQASRLAETKAAITAEELSELERIHQERRDHLRNVCRSRPSDFQVNPRTRYFSFSENHRLLYCSIQKVGCSFWLRVMKILTNQLPRGSLFRGSFIHKGLNGNSISLAEQPVSEQQRILGTFKKFLFVRDPYARIFSGYLDKVFLPNRRLLVLLQRDGGGQRNDSGSERDYSKCKTNMSFAAFIRTLTSGKPRTDPHFSPMFPHCSPCHYGFDYVGKMETFMLDAEFILSKAGVDMSVLSSDDRSFSDDNDLILLEDLAKDRFLHAVKRVPKCPQGDKYVCEVLHRIWTVLQCRGIISTTVPYPFLPNNCSLLEPRYVVRQLKDACKNSGNREVRMRQRKEAMVEAFYSLPKDLLKKTQDYVQKDCDLFGYECSVDVRFPEGGYVGQTSSFFKSYW
ncbi:hypothetical protein BaRGS_00002665, partial [Batillaria attramentaria]